VDLLCAFLSKEYGWSIEYVESLSFSDAQKYHEAAVILKAKDRLHEISVTSYPYMKDKDRKDYRKKLKQVATRADHVEPITAIEMAQRLRNGGFGN